jgi:GT2 family glycosyltransferase
MYRFVNLRYSYANVNDAGSRRAAAHGAFLIVERSVFEGVGGFSEARGAPIDDAVLAETVKRAGYGVGFAPPPDRLA